MLHLTNEQIGEEVKILFEIINGTRSPEIITKTITEIPVSHVKLSGEDTAYHETKENHIEGNIELPSLTDISNTKISEYTEPNNKTITTEEKIISGTKLEAIESRLRNIESYLSRKIILGNLLDHKPFLNWLFLHEFEPAFG